MSEHDEPDYDSILPGGESDTDKLAREAMKTQIEWMKRGLNAKPSDGKSCVLCDRLCAQLTNAAQWFVGLGVMANPLVIVLLGESFGATLEDVADAKRLLLKSAVRNMRSTLEQEAKRDEEEAAAKAARDRG